MSTGSGQIEERIAILEAEVARLKRKIETDTFQNSPWWEKIAGTFANNPAL